VVSLLDVAGGRLITHLVSGAAQKMVQLLPVGLTAVSLLLAVFDCSRRHMASASIVEFAILFAIRVNMFGSRDSFTFSTLCSAKVAAAALLHLLWRLSRPCRRALNATSRIVRPRTAKSLLLLRDCRSVVDMHNVLLRSIDNFSADPLLSFSALWFLRWDVWAVYIFAAIVWLMTDMPLDDPAINTFVDSALLLLATMLGLGVRSFTLQDSRDYVTPRSRLAWWPALSFLCAAVIWSSDAFRGLLVCSGWAFQACVHFMLCVLFFVVRLV
jgi:hypothetical protein